MKTLVTVIILVAVLGATAAWYWARNGDKAVTYRTAKVERGDLVATIGATGTVEPEEVIDVGAQVAGQILEFGKDTDGKPVDYGSDVEAGHDPGADRRLGLQGRRRRRPRRRSPQAKAGVHARRGGPGARSKAKLYQAERDWQRAQKLGPSDALAQVSLRHVQGHLRVGQGQRRRRRRRRSPRPRRRSTQARGVARSAPSATSATRSIKSPGRRA